MTGDRVEAAAKAVVVALEPYASHSRMTYSGSIGMGATPAELAGAVLAAADEADRVAGVVRIDLNDRQQVDALLTAYTDHSENYVIRCKDAEDGCFDCGEALAEIKAAILAAGVGEQGDQP